VGIGLFRVAGILLALLITAGAFVLWSAKNDVGADVVRLPIDFRFRWKSGGAADITSKTGLDPSATLARNFCCDAQRRSSATAW
jgi:hypothetical protein